MRYITNPTEQDIQEVKLWIRQNQAGYDDAFHMAIDCSQTLEVFDRNEFAQTPTWISSLTESYFSGEWE